jgi:microcystin-dependent protein
MWNGDSIPEGWALCDGTKGTPNLIGRFIKASNVSGDIGGGGNVIEDEEITNKVMLTENNIPKHKHPIPKLETSLSGKHSHTYIKQKALLNSDTPTISINNITFKEGSDENFEINVEPININESTESLDTNVIEDH